MKFKIEQKVIVQLYYDEEKIVPGIIKECYTDCYRIILLKNHYSYDKHSIVVLAEKFIRLYVDYPEYMKQ